MLPCTIPGEEGDPGVPGVPGRPGTTLQNVFRDMSFFCQCFFFCVPKLLKIQHVQGFSVVKTNAIVVYVSLMEGEAFWLVYGVIKLVKIHKTKLKNGWVSVCVTGNDM